MTRPTLPQNATPSEGISYAFVVGEWRISTLTDLLTCLLNEGHLQFTVVEKDRAALIGNADSVHYLTADEESIVMEIMDDLTDEEV
jgi:hypothetical protein